mmetsp:Transcript_7002/g.17934  ORF Transcript_7002/g.17934 Transcript_7002/m.17934 type:complete len:201 (-) Transcript_7002:380-982(-)
MKPNQTNPMAQSKASKVAPRINTGYNENKQRVLSDAQYVAERERGFSSLKADEAAALLRRGVKGVVLDLRSAEDYQNEHIRGSTSYPMSSLAHSDPITREIAMAKNKGGHIILFIHEEVVQAKRAAARLVERNVENTKYVGVPFSTLKRSIPELMVTPPPPQPVKEEDRAYVRATMKAQYVDTHGKAATIVQSSSKSTWR